MEWKKNYESGDYEALINDSNIKSILRKNGQRKENPEDIFNNKDTWVTANQSQRRNFKFTLTLHYFEIKIEYGAE